MSELALKAQSYFFRNHRKKIVDAAIFLFLIAWGFIRG